MAPNARPTKKSPEARRPAARGPADTSGLPPSSDMAPHESARRMSGDHAPVDDPNPNVAMAKADVDSGRTGDKNEVFDPGLSMLGTDDEAAGASASPERVRLARETQAQNAPNADAPAPTSIARTGGQRVVIAFVAAIVLFAVAFAWVMFAG